MSYHYSYRQSAKSGKVRTSRIFCQNRDWFQINFFLTIIDSVFRALQERLDSYSLVLNLFVFLREIFTLNEESIRECCNRLVVEYSQDLEPNLADEILHFRSFARTSAVD